MTDMFKYKLIIATLIFFIIDLICILLFQHNLFTGLVQAIIGAAVFCGLFFLFGRGTPQK